MTFAFPPARQRLPLLVLAVLMVVTACTTQSPGVPDPTDIAAISPTPVATEPPTPAATPTLPGTGETPTPLPATPTLAPTPEPTPTVWLPNGSPLPPTQLPPPTPTPVPPTDPPTGGPGVVVPTGDSPPTRIVIRGLGIDLPVMKGNSAYPYCNVAQYMTNFVNPGQPGTTYLYGHARTGMFLPLLTHSKVNDGAAMIGLRVDLYTADKKLHVYRINIVKRHVRDFSLALDLEPGQHRLIMQTSEGPSGLYPKLQVAARPIAVYKSTAAEALPTPRPKSCG